MLHQDQNTARTSNTAQTFLQSDVFISGFSKAWFMYLPFYTVYLCNRTQHYRFHYSNPVTDPFLLVNCMIKEHLTLRVLIRNIGNKTTYFNGTKHSNPLHLKPYFSCVHC